MSGVENLLISRKPVKLHAPTPPDQKINQIPPTGTLTWPNDRGMPGDREEGGGGVEGSN